MSTEGGCGKKKAIDRLCCCCCYTADAPVTLQQFELLSRECYTHTPESTHRQPLSLLPIFSPTRVQTASKVPQLVASCRCGARKPCPPASLASFFVTLCSAAWLRLRRSPLRARGSVFFFRLLLFLFFILLGLLLLSNRLCHHLALKVSVSFALFTLQDRRRLLLRHKKAPLKVQLDLVYNARTR